MRTPWQDHLIAVLLGDAAPSAALERWLATEAGRRERTAYQRTLAAFRRVYGASAASSQARSARVYYDTLDTPVGRLLLATSEHGLVRVAFGGSETAFTRGLRERFGTEVARSPARLAAAARQLRAYFARTRRSFDLPLDLRSLTPFQRGVLLATAEVPAGRVAAYSEIARRIGAPTGSRAVGQALGRNPIPIVIPCHRIVPARGGLGGYLGGLDVKRALLALERALASG